jgi:hypothetical protein
MDARTSVDHGYHAMAALVASGDVRQEAWERYCFVYTAVRAHLALPAPRSTPVLRRGQLLQR